MGDPYTRDLMDALICRRRLQERVEYRRGRLKAQQVVVEESTKLKADLAESVVDLAKIDLEVRELCAKQHGGQEEPAPLAGRHGVNTDDGLKQEIVGFLSVGPEGVGGKGRGYDAQCAPRGPAPLPRPPLLTLFPQM